ncbi:MAG: DegT/DnrJ/EryC1/StrS family aminotransferase [bacterium]
MRQVPVLDLKLEYEYYKQDIEAAIKRCMKHQRWINGPEVKQLEDTAAGFLGVKHCVGVASGTDALVISLRALAIRNTGNEFFDKNDEIITTPYTFSATGEAIIRSGATPVFIDIDPGTFNIDLNQVREYLAENGDKAVGIVPVYLYGQPVDGDGLRRLAEEYDLFVVEDVAQALGGAWQGKRSGSVGTAGAFSFFPSKNLGGFGDGGLISTNDDRTAELSRILLKHGGKDKNNVDHIGYNSRLDTMQAAIVLAKFRYLEEFIGRRRKIAENYARELAGIEGVTLPTVLTGALHSYNQFTIRAARRDELQASLREKGISTMVYYPYPLHRMKVFQGRMKIWKTLDQAELAAREVISLPMEPLLEQPDIDQVIHSIKDFFTT